MKIQINKNILLDILKTNSTITKADNFNPVLSCVYIQAFPDKVVFVYTNGSISIQKTVTEGFEVFEPGVMLIKNKFLLDIISKVSEKSVVLEKTDRTVCSLATDSFKCQINIMDETSYPNLNFEYQHFTRLDLKNTDLIKITTKIANCVLNNGEAHRNISGIGFEYNHDKKILNVSGTDAYKLATLSIPLECDQTFGFIMDLSVSKLLNSLISNKTDNEAQTSLYINQESNEIGFEIDNIVVMSKNIEGKFIETSKYFNNLGELSFEIDKTKLIAALERGFAFVSSDKVTQVVLNIHDNLVDVDFASYEFGASQETIAVQNRVGMNGKLNVNARYLIAILKNVDNDLVKFNYVYQVKPIILTDPKEPNFKQLVLPIRVN